VAKTRKGSRKAAGPAKRGKTKAARKSTRKRVSRVSQPTKRLEFRKLRKQLERAVVVLAEKKARAVDGGARIDDAQRRIERWMADISDFCSDEMQEICGPTMDLELG
jgi:hypothetical protein